MRKAFSILCILFCTWLVACSGATATLPQTPSATTLDRFTTRTSTAPALPESTPSPTEPQPQTVMAPSTTTSSPTPVPTLTPIMPDVVQVCPENPAVPLEKFGLGDYYLVVRPYDQFLGKVPPEASGAIVVPLDHPVAQVIPGSNGRQGWKLIDYKPAVGGQSVELTYQEKGGNRRQIWLSSWDGREQKLMADFSLPPLPPREGYQVYDYQQVDDDWYAVIKSDLHTGTRFPTRIYNRTTSEIRELPPLPTDIVVRNFFWLNGSLYMDYGQGVDLDKVFLYNLETFTAVPIFKWLWNKKDVFDMNTQWIFRDGLFYVQVATPYGGAFGLGLDLDTVKSDRTFSQVMQPYYFPLSEEDYIISGDFLESFSGYLYYRPDPARGTSPIFFLDFSDRTVKDYCYATGNFTTFGSWSSPSISPDQRFIAYTHIEPDTVSDKPVQITRVEILDLVTGEFATISDANYEVIGWGKK